MTLDLVPTDDLLAELARRFDTMIFAGVKTLDAQRDLVHRRREGKGEWFRQMGLAFDMAQRAREALDAEVVDDPAGGAGA